MTEDPHAATATPDDDDAPARPPQDFEHGPALRTFAMPADANPFGDIFGGWLMGQMDVAGAMVAMRRAGGRVATVGVEAMSFHQPVYVGDEVSCFGEILRVGRTSIKVKVDTWSRRHDGTVIRVTEGVFTYVAIDSGRRPRTIPPEKNH